MNTDDKTKRLEQTEKLYNSFLDKISSLCDEVDQELKQINQNTGKAG